jgi:hypothetical protein
MKTRVGFGLRGEYKFILRNEDGSIAQETDWQDNLITDNGLFRFGHDYFTGTWYSNVYVGTGTTPPAITDTQLEAQIGSQGNGSNGLQSGTAIAPDYERWEIRTWRLAAGNGTGTITEAGVGNGSTDLFSRIVLTTPIVKGATQVLDIYWKFWMYPDRTDYTGQVVIKGVTYNWSMKAINLDISGAVISEPTVSTFYHPTIYPETATDGDDTNGISGSGVNHPSVSRSYPAYGTGYKDVFFDIGLGEWITNTGQIQYIYIFCFFGFRLKLTAVDGGNPGGGVPKDSTEVLDLTVRILWDRYTP